MTNEQQLHVDTELRDLLGADRELMMVATRVRDVLDGAEPIDVDFRKRLRTHVVAERAQVIAGRQREAWWQRWLDGVKYRPALALPALAAAMVAALAVAVVAAPRLFEPQAAPVAMSSAVAGQAALDPSTPVTLSFTRPVERSSVASALRISPATLVRTGWRGDRLVVTPVHGWVPNSPYAVTVDGVKARTPAGIPLAGDLRMSFGTAPVAPAPSGGTVPQAVAAFASAQVRGDVATMRSDAGPGVAVDRLPRATRVSVVQVLPQADGSATAQLRLVDDPDRAHPSPRVADEALRVAAPRSGATMVESASAGPFGPEDQGPHVVRVARGAAPNMVLVTYDCDMDAGSVPGTNFAKDQSGRSLPLSTSYDPATRTVTVTLPVDASGVVQLTVTEGLRDVDGRHMSTTLHTTVAL